MVIALVDRIYLRPFEWGVSDCCTRACDVFAALHGVDPMAPLRGRYKTRLGALRLIRRMGGWQAMTEALAAQAGLVPGGAAQGDLGLVETGRGPGLAVRALHGWAAPLDNGVVILPRALASWGVAHG